MSYAIINMWTPPSMFHIKSPFRMDADSYTIHNTANTASARNEGRYMNSNNNQTSYHVANDHIEVVQLIPFNRNAWAAGDGANGPGNRRSIHHEICYSMDNGYSGAKSARYKQAEENAALYAAHVFHEKGWGVNKLRQHFDWSGKDCPHKIRATLTWNWFVNRVQQHLNALKGTTGVKPTTTAPKKPAAPKPVPANVGGSVVDYMVSQGMDSSFNNRKKLAGQYGISNYTGTGAQNIELLNKLKGGSAPSSGSSSSKSIAQMANEVESGQHGSGHANRQKSLGVNNATYQKVRAEVNRRAGVSSAPKAQSKGKSVNQMATEVINGQHGSGHANRRRSLGVSNSVYQQVRNEVNRRAGGGSSAPRGKSINQMAQEVKEGRHGTGHANRQRSLGVDNATYQKVRNRVNQIM